MLYRSLCPVSKLMANFCCIRAIKAFLVIEDSPGHLVQHILAIAKLHTVCRLETQASHELGPSNLVIVGCAIDHIAPGFVSLSLIICLDPVGVTEMCANT